MKKLSMFLLIVLFFVGCEPAISQKEIVSDVDRNIELFMIINAWELPEPAIVSGIVLADTDMEIVCEN